jgi:hypothetical protein
LSSLLLYSTNPWITYEIVQKYRGGKFYVWCSEYYDPRTAALASSAAMIAPSSSPKGIFDTLANDCHHEDSHSFLIQQYKKTFRRLAKTWYSKGEIDKTQMQEIIATINSKSWNIWRPVLFLIPKANIIPSSRIMQVEAKSRAAYGQEFKILELDKSEFEMIER